MTTNQTIKDLVNQKFDHISKKIDNLNNQVSPIVYHGTFGEFEEFDKSKLGSATGSPSAFEGFFFASNQKVAIGYASTLSKILIDLHTNSDLAIEEIERLTGYSFIEAAIKLNNNEYDKDTSEKLNELFNITEKAEDFDLSEEMQKELELDTSGFLKKAILHYKNPLIYDMEGKGYVEIEYKNLIIKAKNEGNDAVIIQNTYDYNDPHGFDELTDIYVVFDESQIEEILL